MLFNNGYNVNSGIIDQARRMNEHCAEERMFSGHEEMQQSILKTTAMINSTYGVMPTLQTGSCSFERMEAMPSAPLAPAMPIYQIPSLNEIRDEYNTFYDRADLPLIKKYNFDRGFNADPLSLTTDELNDRSSPDFISGTLYRKKSAYEKELDEVVKRIDEVSRMEKYFGGLAKK